MDQLDSHHSHANGVTGYVAVGAAALLSAFGWYALGKWVRPDDPGTKFLLAFMRTVFTLLPALVAFWVANRRQREAERQMALRLDSLKMLMGQYQRLQSVDNELATMDRLAKVARHAVVSTGASSKELFGAIEAVQDRASKDLLLERYRHHTNSVVTVLNAVSEQLSESGRSISENITADDSINIVERADANATNGLAYATKIIETRGIGDGLKQLKTSIDRAQSLQGQISEAVEQMEKSSTKVIIDQETPHG
jgi:hypothetical protein